MPRKKVIPLDRLNTEINAILDEYNEDVSDSVKKTVRSVAQKAAKAVRAEAKNKFKGSRYSKGWTYKFTTLTSKVDFQAVVYNKDRYQLAHLLEFGHVSRNGTGRTFGRVSGRPHIQPVEESVNKELYSRIVGFIK